MTSSAPPSAPPPDPVPTSSPGAPPSVTVVLVDDAPEVRSLVRTHLRLSGRFVVVGEGGSGLDAVALAAEHRPSLMLLDVSMPLMDGLAALPRVREVSPGTHVVLFSGFDERGLAARGRELGALGFVEKSVPVERLGSDLLALLTEDQDLQARQDRQQGAVAPRTVQDPTARPDRPGGPVLTEDLERFREVFEEAAIGMATMTLTGRVVRANRALAEVLGLPFADLLGTEYASLAADEAADRVRSLVGALNDGQVAVAQVEHRLTTGTGPPRQVAATIAVVRGQLGRPLYLFLQAQDVTQQRRADEQLRQSEERFRLLVEAVEDYAIFMLDTGGHVASWNAGAQRIKGYTAEEIVGEHFRRFYPADKQLERHPEHELEIALREGHYEEEGWRVRKDGSTFWANVVITAVHNAAGEHVGYAKVTRDITERRHAAEAKESAATALATAKVELEAMNARLLQAAADQSEFLAVTAHELRTPVTVLAGSADTLSHYWTRLDGDERDQLLTGMVTSATRLRRLLDELLTAARLEAGVVELDLQPVTIADVLVGSAAAARQRHPEADIVVTTDRTVVVRADRDRLAQAVDNLLTNAVHHGAPPIHVGMEATADSVVVRVADGGPGVPPEMRARLFERFATGRSRRGTGLGLYIVQELARAHGGLAWYEPPADGRRSTFALSLPRHQPLDEAGEASEASEAGTVADDAAVRR